jgi:hypothetical protein
MRGFFLVPSLFFKGRVREGFSLVPFKHFSPQNRHSHEGGNQSLVIDRNQLPFKHFALLNFIPLLNSGKS